MEYKLAQQLKDAGYKQVIRFDSVYLYPNNNRFLLSEIADDLDNTVYEPTLSELIEACGDGFWRLEFDEEREWTAYGAPDEEGKSFEIKCSTSKEAVAKLYLELNK